MKLFVSILMSFVCLGAAFQAQPQSTKTLSFQSRGAGVARVGASAPLYGFLGDQERDGLTRDSEPEDFFATNTDKMSDEEKIPIAIAGVAFITLPFIAGLIALYSAQN